MALETLKQAQIKLDSVKSWITIDGFGGSLLISIVKHSKIEETLQVLEEAKKNVRRFQLQLKTIELPMSVKKDVGIFDKYPVIPEHYMDEVNEVWYETEQKSNIK